MSSRVPLPVQRAARKVSAEVGRLTGPARMLPSFLIVGAQRCGTTSLYKTVTEHPNVIAGAAIPGVPHKGVHYFDTGYAHGESWYRGHFPLKISARRLESKLGTPVVTCESSPYYMFHPLAGQRIAADLPGVRLVVSLRDPVERAYSAYTHEKARGFETESFERALELEPSRIAGEAERMAADPTYLSEHLQHNAYLTRGHYIDQIERLEALVGRDRLHVIDSGDLFTDEKDILAGLFDFLRLPAWAPESFDQHNARPRTSMTPELHATLSEGFADSDARLATWLGRTPSWRR